MDRTLDIIDLAEAARELVAECELTGRRTVITRNGRSVAMVISFDEYSALRETLDLTTNGPLREAIAEGEEQVKRGAILLVEDLLKF